MSAVAEPRQPLRWRGGLRGPSLLLLAVLVVLTVVKQVGPASPPWVASVPAPQRPCPVTTAGTAGSRVPAPAPSPAPRRHSDTSRLPAGKAAAALPAGDNSSYVSMCIIAKDEHCDIREWVLHHASIGVGKFYLFDTQSDPPMQPVLDDLIASGLVSYHYLTNDTREVALEAPPPGRSINWQRPVYSHCLERYGPRHAWMAFFDADEFVMLEGATPGRPGSLPDLLRKYTDRGGLALHWQFFSFGRHVLRPPGGVLASYTACSPRISSFVKSIVQPKYATGLQTVHTFTYGQGRYAVNTAGVRVRRPQLQKKQATGKGAVLHHYISRSLADFEVKTRRRGGAGSVKTLDNFLDYHRAANSTCTAAVMLGLALAEQYDLNRHVPERCLDTERRRRRARRRTQQ